MWQAYNVQTAQWAYYLIITSSLRQNDVATKFWRNNDIVIASWVRWRRSMPSLLVPWLLESPVHQQLWYVVCERCFYLTRDWSSTIRGFSVSRNDMKYIRVVIFPKTYGIQQYRSISLSLWYFMNVFKHKWRTPVCFELYQIRVFGFIRRFGNMMRSKFQPRTPQALQI